jgi:hypothetical protein
MSSTINSVNNSLTGATGTGSFVGTDSPSLTGKVDCSTTSCEIPNNTAPTISASGHIALDTSVAGFKPTITYHNNAAAQALVAVKAANLATTNGYVIAYDSANGEFKMQAEAGGKGILQFGIFPLAEFTTTTSTTPVATGVTINITPTVSTNKIVCEVFGNCVVGRNGGNIINRYGTYYLIRTVSGTPTTLTTTDCGLDLIGSSTAAANTWSSFTLYYEEIPGSTTARTYSLSFSVPTSNATNQLMSQTFILVYEIEV